MTHDMQTQFEQPGAAAAAPQASIECKSLVFKRGLRTVLDNINLRLKPGAMTALIGHNGAGKSTLLKLALGLLQPASGSITVLGQKPGTTPFKVGYLPENVSFYDQMSMRAHLTYFAALKRVETARALALADELGLTDVLNQRLGQCSKGQRQRLGLAQALLTDPELLILDEPTVGLDPAASLLMYRELSRLRDAGCSVVVCSHELALVEHYLDDAVVISHGKLAAAGTLEEMRTAAGLPVRISHVDIERVKGVPELSECIRGESLVVAAERLEQTIEILTRRCGVFDFEVQKAGPSALFGWFVLGERDGVAKMDRPAAGRENRRTAAHEQGG